MTISSTARKVGPFSGTGTQNAYPFNFKVFAPSNVLVVQTDATGAEYTLALTAQYSLSLTADQDGSPGGIVTLPANLPAGNQLTISSVVPITQGTVIPNMGGFYPKVIERALDKLTIAMQQTAEVAGRWLRFAFSDSGGGATLPTVAARAGKFLTFDAAGNPVAASGTGADAALRTDVAASNGAGLIGFKAAGLGAPARTLLDRGLDTVSAFDYMTPAQVANVRSGVVTDITAAVQAACNSFTVYAGIVELPPGNFRLSAPIVTSIKGLKIRGSSRYGTYLTAADGSTFDMIRLAHQQCEVSGIIFRPGSTAQVPIRIYASRAHVHDNYLLAAVNNGGIGILLTDLNPDTNAFVAGAYAHVIENNVIGDSGFAFANAIYDSSSFGITASKFFLNNILSDRPIQINKGGGNSYFGNLLQSSTGTSGTKAGVGITLGAGVVGEKIWGNYIELFLAMVEVRSTDNTYQLAHIVGNHNDNCAAPVADAGAKNYILEDAVGKVVNNFGWSIRSTATQWGVNTPSGVNMFGGDTNGNCFIGANSGASHIFNKPGSTGAPSS